MTRKHLPASSSHCMKNYLNFEMTLQVFHAYLES